MSAFLDAARGLPVSHTPVWFMRQAGRSLPEYKQVRAGIPMLESCRRPELVCEITLQPVRRHNVDAAILFSDIVVPLAAAGVDLDIVAGVGPVVASPVSAMVDLPALLDPSDVSFVDEAVRLLVKELGSKTPVIGFAGAPFTLASYLIEGGPSKHHEKTKALMHGNPSLWHALLGRLAEITQTFLQVQVSAGVSAIQLFDSWAGALSEADYRRFVLPHSAAVMSAFEGVVPRIHFGVGTALLLPAMASVTDVLGVDWRTPLDTASALAPGKALQGNLDPSLLFAPWDVIESETRRIVAEGRSAPGHIFNLGHGVMPETNPEVLTRLVSLIHSL